MSTNLDDERTIDALCRLNEGWSNKIEGDQEDYRAAFRLIQERAQRVAGSFRNPTEHERCKAALVKILEWDRVHRTLPTWYRTFIEAALSPQGRSEDGNK